MFSPTVQNFIDSIYTSHMSNTQSLYAARRATSHGRAVNVSPFANFVFEYFLYNSLYAIDWEQTLCVGRLIEHDRDAGRPELTQQMAFLKFCRQQLNRSDGRGLSKVFAPLHLVDDWSGDWTTITADGRLSTEDGRRFFSKIAKLGELAADGTLLPNKNYFDLIAGCCRFVYMVRNNIFHGSKSIGEIAEPNQVRRIVVYDLFVRCLNSLFFEVSGKSVWGANMNQLAIQQEWRDFRFACSPQQVTELVLRNQLRAEDSLLHKYLQREGLMEPTVKPGLNLALIYPSAGRDLLFPLLVGLPHCTDFFFYDRNLHEQRTITNALRTLGISEFVAAEETSDSVCYHFLIGQVERRIWAMHRDNLDFLKTTIPIAFYFHRGDSAGEGGSGQDWGGIHIHKLLERSPRGLGLRILSDGGPMGLDPMVRSRLTHVKPPNSHRYRDYWYGVIDTLE